MYDIVIYQIRKYEVIAVENGKLKIKSENNEILLYIDVYKCTKIKDI